IQRFNRSTIQSFTNNQMKLATSTLFFCVAALLALGMVMLFSASTGQPQANYLIMQPIWCGLGLFACLFTASGDYRWLKKYPWIHLEETKMNKGLQAYQAMVALGSGGVRGVGLGDGRQKLGFVPEHHTDFIFSVIGEELGLIATLLVLLAYVAIAICGVYIAWN